MAKKIIRVTNKVARFVLRMPRQIAKRVLLLVLASLRRHPALKASFARLLEYFANLDYRMRSFAQANTQGTPSSSSEEGQTLDWTQYPSGVRVIYEQLRQAIKKSRE